MPRTVWALGFVSLFTDMSSELVHSLLPILMGTVLGAPMVAIGVIEGVAEATAAIAKFFSGTISDRIRRRKPLVVLGYGLSAMVKPVFPLAMTLWAVAGARFADRIGKGIRGAPRDALLVDITPPTLRGAAFGLRQALDSVGAVGGPLLAMAGMIWFANDITTALWVAVIPALLAMLVLVIAVREPEHPASPRSSGLLTRPDWNEARSLPLGFWFVVAIGAVFTLARFSEAFLILRAQDVGLAISRVPLVMIIMNIVYAVGAYPAGSAADRSSARTLLLFGLAVLIAADLLLAGAASSPAVLGGAACWGLHMALTQGLLAKLVADAAPEPLRGTAFGVFHLASGGAVLLASVLAGSLWQAFGASVTFLFGAACAVVAALALLWHPPERWMAQHG